MRSVLELELELEFELELELEIELGLLLTNNSNNTFVLIVMGKLQPCSFGSRQTQVMLCRLDCCSLQFAAMHCQFPRASF